MHVHDDELIIRISDDNRRLDSIERADPVIWLPNEALDILVTHHINCNCGIHLYSDENRYPVAGHHHGHLCEPCNSEYCFTGCRFVLEPAHGNRIVYVVKDYDWCRNAWRAAWPD